MKIESGLKTQAIELLEESVEKTLQDTTLGQEFPERSPPVQEIARFDKCDQLIFKSCITKGSAELTAYRMGSLHCVDREWLLMISEGLKEQPLFPRRIMSGQMRHLSKER